MIKNLVCFSLLIYVLALCSCSLTQDNNAASCSLAMELSEYVNSVPGTVGIAYVSGNDTVCINNGVHFPLMSVFKLHESLAVLDALKRKGISVDTILDIRNEEIDRETWSPMLQDFTEPDFKVSVGKLIDYAIAASDNNASNILFQRIIMPKEVDRYIRTITPDTTFSIAWTEAEMKQNHDRAYDNYTSPLSAALLIKKVMDGNSAINDTDSIIRRALTTVTTGQDRLGVVLKGRQDVVFAHKTGSGYRNMRGELIAHNDVGYFRFPDGSEYALAVFISDFRGAESAASKVIADISRIVYSYHELGKH